MLADDGLYGGIGLTHVHVAVAVVAHEAECVLPVAGVGIGGVVDDFVDHDFGLGLSAGRQTAHADVGAVALGQAGALALVEHTEEIVADVAHGLAERVLAFIAQQIVVGRSLTPVGGKHTVVPGPVAEEQQIARHVGLALSTVVEHLQVAAVGVGVGCAAAELVEELVGRHDAHAQRIALLVQSLQSLGLRQQFLRRRNDDDHIGGSVGMMVLIGDAIDKLRLGEGVAAEPRCRCRPGHGER